MTPEEIKQLENDLWRSADTLRAAELDHIIFNRAGYYSFLENKCILKYQLI